MTTYHFEVAENEEYGGLGFRPQWYPHGDPLSGMAVAHDILEHFKHDQGDAVGELQALGAALFIRGDSGYFQKNGNVNSTEKHLGAELGNVWNYHTQRDGLTSLPPCGVMRYHETMEQCRQTVRGGLQAFEDRRGIEKPNHHTRELMARWMARGYKRAQKRYGNQGANIAYSLFAPIEERADKLLKHAEAGMVLTVRVNCKTLQVTSDLDYPNPEEY